jgi:hypothetical protein
MLFVCTYQIGHNFCVVILELGRTVEGGGGGASLGPCRLARHGCNPGDLGSCTDRIQRHAQPSLQRGGAGPPSRGHAVVGHACSYDTFSEEKEG